MKKLEIYTDGSMNRGSGGAAIVVIAEGELLHECGLVIRGPTTNNIAELTACNLALAFASSVDSDMFSSITIVTDSRYVETCWNNGLKWEAANWQNTSGAVKNVVLVRELLLVREDVQQLGILLNIRWVKGHNGDTFNEQVDKLANVYSARAAASLSPAKVNTHELT